MLNLIIKLEVDWNFNELPYSFVFPQFTLFHSVFHSFSLNELSGLQCMSLHSSAGRALQCIAEATGSNPVEAPKNFFRVIFTIA